MSATIPPAALPLVGREREQAMLRAALAAALAGRGSLVLIGGEAGIGKTTLAEALLAEARPAAALALVGRCYDLSETPPYGPWIEAFARAPRGDVLPTPPDLASGGAASQGALFASVREYLVATTARQPVVLLLDDLQWSDPASLDLLRAVNRHLAALPLLLLATYRADELTRHHRLYTLLPLLEREMRATRLDLRPLDERATRALVERYGLPEAAATRLATWLEARAAGNALFTTQLLRALEDEAALMAVPGGWTLGDLGAVGLPEPLRQVLDARIDRLGEDTRDLLSLAAVIGQDVPLALWSSMAGADEDDLLDPIDRAVEARLLEASPSGTSVRFSHALIREALYKALLPMRRRRLHRRAADILATTPNPDPNAVAYHLLQAGDDRAGEWLERAADRARRAYAWVTAAERLEAALALAEQREDPPGTRGWLLLRIGLLLRQANRARTITALDAAAASASAAADPLLANLARFYRGSVRILIGEHRAGMSVAEFVAENRIGLAAMDAAIAALEDHWPPVPTMLDRLRAWGIADDLDYYRASLVHWYGALGYLSTALALGEPLAARTPLWSDSAALFGIFRGLGMAHALLGHPDAAAAWLERAIAASVAAGDHGQAAMSMATLLACVLLPYRADDVAGRRSAAAKGESTWAQASGTQGSVPWLTWNGPFLLAEGDWAELRSASDRGDVPRRGGFIGPAHIAYYQGDYEVAGRLLGEALPAAAATRLGEMRLFVEWPLVLLGIDLALAAGDLAQAHDWLVCNDRLLAESGAVLGLANAQLAWAAYHRAAGDAALARVHAQSALAHASDPRQPLALLAAHRILAELDTAAGRYTDAQLHLDQSLALAEACAAPYEHALTLLALAERHLATADHDQAHAAGHEARALITPLQARPAMARADALASRLDSSRTAAPPIPAAVPFGLTAREAEVLRLVARGLPNAEIAARLSLSHRTVEQHLRSVYGKLGVENRTAAARLAIERSLAGGAP